MYSIMTLIMTITAIIIYCLPVIINVARQHQCMRQNSLPEHIIFVKLNETINIS